METFIAALFSWFVSLADVSGAKALMLTAKDTRLTITTAPQHLAAARFAGILTDVEPDLILAITYHESRFDPTVVGPPVAGGKRACGVMQHVPVVGPCPKRSLMADYLAGARHIAVWIQAQRGNLERALIGYAGGYTLIKRCDDGEARRACSIAGIHLARAKQFKRARELGQPRART